MLISLIVAVAENGVIGRDGGLPWRMSSDLKTFRRITMGKPIVMGRKTFATLKKPLDGRENIVVTRDKSFRADGVTVVNSIEAALEAARRFTIGHDVREAMVIGGAEIYRTAVAFADRIYLTQVHAAPEGDTLFEGLEPGVWREVSAEPLAEGPRDEFAATLRIFERICAPLPQKITKQP